MASAALAVLALAGAAPQAHALDPTPNGVSNPVGPGGNGSSNPRGGGGGGGGAGVTGGAGAPGDSPAGTSGGGGAGGLAPVGANPAGNGDAGGDGEGGGSGGGGGGAAHGYFNSVSPTGVLVGGIGGDGGDGSAYDGFYGTVAGGAGNGGAGGFGASLTPGASPIVISQQVRGGNGGNGGDGVVVIIPHPGELPTIIASGGADGGAGGHGVFLSGDNGTLIIQQSVTGGDGGDGGDGSYGGAGGLGGAGLVISGDGWDVSIAGGATVTGGDGGQEGGGRFTPGEEGIGNVGILITGSNNQLSLAGGAAGGNSGGGLSQAGAFLISGDSNTVILEAGYSASGIVATGNTNILALGGASDGIFDMTNVGPVGATIAGFYTMEKLGTSTWTLTGTPAVDLSWTIEDGTLSIASASSLGLGSGTLTFAGGTLQATQSLSIGQAVTLSAAGGSVDVLPGQTLTLSGVVSGAGGLTLTDSGTLALNGANSFSGGVNLTQGTVRVGSSQALGTGTLNMSGGTTLAFGVNGLEIGNDINVGGMATIYVNAISGALASPITGTGGVTLAGDGTLYLTAANSFTGGTTIEQGTLYLGNGNVAGSILGGVTNNGVLVFNAPVDQSFAGVISGTGAVRVQGGATVTLTASNSFSGGITIANGSTLVIAADAALGGGAGGLTLESGTLATTGSFATARPVVLDGTASGTLTSTVLDVVAGTTLTLTAGMAEDSASALTKSGRGTLVLAGTNGFSAGLILGDGIVEVAADSALGAVTGGVTLAGGTLAMTASFQTERLFAVSPPGGTLDVAAGQTVTLDGALSGSGSLVKAGAGTLTMTADSSFSGPTTVLTGTLGLYGASLAASPVTVAGGATLTGFGSVNSIAVLAGGTLAGGWSGKDNPQAIPLLAATATLDPAAISLLTLGSGANSGIVTVRGDLALGGTLDVAGAPPHGAGIYRAFSYGGSLTGSVTLGSTPVGYTTTLDLSNDGQVNLALRDASPFQFWTATGGALGGSGSWTATSDTWVEAAFGIENPWGGEFGIFMGTAGTVTLEGRASFEQLEFVSDGYVIAPANAGSGLSVHDGSRIWVEGHDVTATIGVAITGTGGLEKIGAGRLVLTGDNEFVGGLRVSGGMVEVARDAGLGVAGGTIELARGGLLAAGSFNTGRTITLDGFGVLSALDGQTLGINGTIIGTGTLIKSGDGTVRLAGGNSFDGGTRIMAGRLVAAGGRALADGHGVEIDAPGTFALEASETIGSLAGEGSVELGAHTLTTGGDNQSTRFSGVIAGSGRLVKTGSGVMVLDGDNSFTGGTTIAGGQVTLGHGGTTGSLVGDVRNDGVLAVNRSDTLILDGTISGTGALVQQGWGTLILTGQNSYTGGTTITAGTLQIGNGGTQGWIVGPIVNDGALVYDLSSFYVFPAALTGSGSVTLTGGGSVLYAGSSFAGPVFVQQASLELASGVTSGSSFTIGAGGLLSGTGTIAALTVNSGGVVAPGYSPGTLVVAGNAAFNAGAIYQVDVAPGQVSDLIAVGGYVTIADGAQLKVVGAAGSYANSWSFNVLSAAGGIIGTFSGATSNFAFLDPVLSYSATDIEVTLVRNDIPFWQEARTANERATAIGVESLGAGNPVYDAVAAQLSGQAYAAFDALSGEIYASAETVMMQQSAYVRDAVNMRLRQAFGEGDLTGPATAALGTLPVVMWVTGVGGLGDSFGDGNAATIANSVGGVLAGFDATFNANWRGGVFGGYSSSWFDVEDRASSGSMDSYTAGLYAGGQYGPLALRLGGAYTWHDVSVTRSIVFPGYDAGASTSYTTGETQIFGQIGYAFALEGHRIEPFAGLAYVNLDDASALERGSSAALDVASGGMDTVYGTLGVTISKSFESQGRRYTPSITVGWQHAFGDITPEATMQFASGSDAFIVSGVPIAEDALVLGASLGIGFGPTASLALVYDGQIASSATQSAFSGQLLIRF
ncbi:autotransporter domain-containing protein [Ancylobacter sp. WKF20]|uniref:autotransporter domain-containing protein n=1 Tax=Ancylobacter sp. WKF20 TaxID=3039801 RepID=UPI0024340EAA|nr:autotransporter domain-containing protein [Ancylobacter sp. WKF20]WGD31063.1 autotransporter domain-containing protein [Ancylobacter sp. WKF20]